MKLQPLAQMGISALMPPDLRRQLIDAENWPQAQRAQRIDKITDEAARRGIVRPRSDDSLAERWAAMRTEPGAPT